MKSNSSRFWWSYLWSNGSTAWTTNKLWWSRLTSGLCVKMVVTYFSKLCYARCCTLRPKHSSLLSLRGHGPGLFPLSWDSFHLSFLVLIQSQVDWLNADFLIFNVLFLWADNALLWQQSISGNALVDLWSAQCAECFKWRLIPTEEEFEEIRSKLSEDPFLCSKKPGVSCDDPADIERDETRTWAIHKPGIPKTPSGFKRTLIMRRDLSKMDCYYDAPNGKKLRA